MKKKTVWLSIGMLVLMASAINMLANNPAVVVEESLCALLDGNGSIVSADSSQTVVAASGNSKMSCKANVDPSSTGTAVRWDFDNTGLSCETPTGLTTDWQETVSAAGQATITCHSQH
jgi:hypothetical protein